MVASGVEPDPLARSHPGSISLDSHWLGRHIFDHRFFKKGSGPMKWPKPYFEKILFELRYAGGHHYLDRY